MAKVEIYKLLEGGNQEIIVVCKLYGDMVVCVGDNELINQLINDGILDYANDTPKKLFPSDGKRFLEQLKYNFNSGYLNASDLLDTEDPTIDN